MNSSVPNMFTQPAPQINVNVSGPQNVKTLREEFVYQVPKIDSNNTSPYSPKNTEKRSFSIDRNTPPSSTFRTNAFKINEDKK